MATAFFVQLLTLNSNILSTRKLRVHWFDWLVTNLQDWPGTRRWSIVKTTGVLSPGDLSVQGPGVATEDVCSFHWYTQRQA